MRIKVINGPNLNLLGIREKEVYGAMTYEMLVERIERYGEENDIVIDVYQSNSEGLIIDAIHESYFKGFDGLIINPGAYTHYSYAIRDALKSVEDFLVIVEVHLSNINEREAFRRVSVIADVVDERIMGKGYQGYLEAIDYIRLKKS